MRAAHFGDTRLHGVVGDFTVSEVTFAPFARLPEHSHDEPQLSMVIEGSMIERGSALGDIAAPNGACYRPAGYVHTNAFPAAETRGLVIGIHGARWRSIAPLFANTAAARYAHVPRLLSVFRRIHDELTGSGPARALALEAALLEFAVAVGRAFLPADLLVPIVAAIDSDPARKWDALALAEVVGATPGEVAASIRGSEAGSLAGLVLRSRIAFARRLLIETSHPIADVAAAAGFFDQAHLTRALARATGSTPLALRRAPRPAG